MITALKNVFSSLKRLLFRKAPRPATPVRADKRKKKKSSKEKTVIEHAANEGELTPTAEKLPPSIPRRRRVVHVFISALVLFAGTAAWYGLWRSPETKDTELMVAPRVRAALPHPSAAVAWLPATSKHKSAKHKGIPHKDGPPRAEAVSAHHKTQSTAATHPKKAIAVVLFCEHSLPSLRGTLKQLPATLTVALPPHATPQATHLPASYPVFAVLSLDEPHLTDRLNNLLSTFPKVSGVTYASGSPVLADATFMHTLLHALQARKLFFLDTGASLASIARKEGNKEPARLLHATWVVRNAEQLRYAHTQLKGKPLTLVVKGSWHHGTYLRTLKRFLASVQRNPTYQLTFATHVTPHP